ncbi:MAG: type VI secretion system accessory protein TagJ, partial [Planctomycetota bacterium]
EVHFDAPERPLDLLWRAATMDVRDGPEGKVYLPAVYAVNPTAMDDDARLGKKTDWMERAGGSLISGVGMRTFLVGEEAKTLMELDHLEFAGSA